MGKKVVFAVFGGIALLGLVFSLVGWVMGGRPGRVRVAEGNMVYQAEGKSARIARAPHWARNIEGATLLSLSPGESFTNLTASWNSSSVRGGGAAQNVELPFTAAELTKVELEIDAGYVILQGGDSLSLTVDGPLAYNSQFSSGTWTVSSKTDLDSIVAEARGRQGEQRFFLDGRDVTTIFTLTVPAAGLQEIYAELSLGGLSAKGLTCRELSLSQNLGSIEVETCQADEASFQTDLGAAEIRGFTGKKCDLKADLGSVQFEGSVSDELDVECGLGSVEVTMPRPEQYSYNAEVSLGSIQIDGQAAAGVAAANENGSALPHFELQCDLGSIEVRFTD